MAAAQVFTSCAASASWWQVTEITIIRMWTCPEQQACKQIYKLISGLDTYTIPFKVVLYFTMHDHVRWHSQLLRVTLPQVSKEKTPPEGKAVFLKKKPLFPDQEKFLLPVLPLHVSLLKMTGENSPNVVTQGVQMPISNSTVLNSCSAWLHKSISLPSWDCAAALGVWVQGLLGQGLHKRCWWYPCCITGESTISATAPLDTAAAPIALHFPKWSSLELQWQRVPWSSARTASPSPGSSQGNWSNNRTHGRWCGLGYQTQLTGNISHSGWVSLWSLTATPHRHSSLAPKIRMVIRTHSSLGNALRAPTPVQHKLSFSVMCSH